MINAKTKYRMHKNRAKQRNIEFLLSFDEWLEVWQKSGKAHLRGVGTNRYCMARYNDIGPYAVNNVYITTNHDNLQFAKTKQNNPCYKGKIQATHKDTSKRLVFCGKKELIANGFNPGAVYACIRKETKSHKNYIWERI